MSIQAIKVHDIIPNPNNPRKNFDEAALEELAASIKEVGILQPLVVTYDNMDGDGKLWFRLVCGERRWLAAQIAGLEDVPANYLPNLTPTQEAEIMLVENLQRKDLDPIEEAAAFQSLLQEHGYTQEVLAEKLGVSQGHIANRIRLLDLPETVQENISRGIISASHGKVLAGHRNLPAPIMEKAVEAIANDNVPVAKADTLVLRLVAEKGLPLFDNYRKKPEFKSGKGSECYTCGNRAMGKDMYVSGDNEQPFCLNPECWEKKQEEAQQKKLEKAQKAGAEENTVDISKLSYTQYSYWYKESTDYDQSECKNCEHLKKDKRSDMLFCLEPACMKKKKTAKTKADNAKKKDTFQAELGQITEMVAGWIDQTVRIDRTTLIYLAAQVIANVDPWHDRKITRYQYLKNKFGWENDTVKSGAYNLLYHDWDTFRQLLESLDELQLLEVIMEWPAVARGLKGAEGWFLQQVPEVEPKEEPGPDPVHELIGRSIMTHYDTGGVVTTVTGPSNDGLYNLVYRDPRDGRPCYINRITLKDGVILCEGNPLVVEDPEPEPEPGLLPARRYLDKNGRVIFVSTGLGGSEFGTFWESPAGGKHRVKTAAMPMTPSKKEAQRNLDAWAEKNGLQAVDGDDPCQPRTA